MASTHEEGFYCVFRWCCVGTQAPTLSSQRRIVGAGDGDGASVGSRRAGSSGTFTWVKGRIEQVTPSVNQLRALSCNGVLCVLTRPFSYAAREVAACGLCM